MAVYDKIPRKLTDVTLGEDSEENLRSRTVPYLDVRAFRDPVADGTDYAPAVNRALAKRAELGGAVEVVLPNRAERYRTAMPISANTYVHGGGSATEVIQDYSGWLFRVSGTHGAKANLTQNALAGSATVTLPTGAGAAFGLGSLIGLESTTVVYGAAGRTRDIRRVVARSGDVVTLDAPLLHDVLTSAGAQYWLVSPVKDVTVGGFAVTNPNPEVNFGYVLDARVTDGLRVLPMTLRDAGGSVGLVDALDFLVDGLLVDRLRNGTVFGGDTGITSGPNIYRPAYGYGVWVAGASSFGLIEGLRGNGVRHLFTTLPDQRGDGTLWGGPREVTVAHGLGAGSDYALSIWDTHEYGSDITFDGCKGVGAVKVGVGAFQVRAKRVRIVAGEGKHGYRGVITAAGLAEDVRIEGGEYAYNAEAGIADSGLRTQVVGAHIHHNDAYGISNGYTSDGAVYRDNDIHHNGTAGISFRAQTGQPTVFGTNPLIDGNNIPFATEQFWGVENLPATGRAVDNVMPGYAGANAFRTANAAGSIKRNVGYDTEAGGVVNAINGTALSHGMERTPTRVVLTPSVAGRRVAVTAISATTVTIALQDAAGANISVAEPVYWMAEV